MTWTKSGLASTFRLSFNDGAEPLVVRTSVADAVGWERAHKKPYQENVSASSMLWTAWAAARRQGLVGAGPFDAFVARVEDFEIAQEESEDPTNEDLSVD